MITLVIGFVVLILFTIGILLLGSNQLIPAIVLIAFSSIIGFFGWGLVWFGNNWSLFFAKLKYFKGSGKGLLIDLRKDGRVKLMFINAGAKKLELIYAAGKQSLTHTIIIGEPFGNLFGFGLPVYFHRQGALATSLPEENLEITDQAPQMTDLLKQTAQTMRLNKKQNLFDNNVLMLILMVIAVITILGVAFLVFQQGTQLTALGSQISSLSVNPALNVVSHPAATNSIVPGLI